MRIARTTISNFRCLKQVTVEIDRVTTLIGPNGVGKSSVLRALDWFFNGEQGDPLTAQDVYSGADDQRIRVQVDFTDLTPEDREKLGDKYAPERAETFTAWKTWENGQTKLTGKAFAFPPFEVIRDGGTATERKELWNSLKEADPELGLPTWPNDQNAHAWMDDWERDNPDRLSEAEVSSTEFFGFAGQAVLSGLFDFVLITADLRATEETQDSRNSIVGRILAKTVDREAANSAVESLIEGVSEKHQEIMDEHIGPQVATISEALTQEVQSMGGLRGVEISPSQPDLKAQPLKFEVTIDDKGIKTQVSRQGHGFQRSLLTAALKLLATRGASDSSSSVIFLAIEEPELFLHPTQAKSFAASLRSLAENTETGLQVGYATHSPYFVEARHFDQIRRIERNHDGENPSEVSISHATMDGVISLLGDRTEARTVEQRLDNVCLDQLREALFAPAVILVEGTTDRAVIEGTFQKDPSSELSTVEVACARSKNRMALPIAILKHLNIPFVVVLDGDAGKEDRMKDRGKSETDIASAIGATQKENRELLSLLGHPEADWPEGVYGDNLFVFRDRLEDDLWSGWPEFLQQRETLIEEGRGVSGKDAATYRIAALEAEGIPEFIDHISNLIGSHL